MSSIVQASGTEIVPCNLSLELSDKSFDSTDTPPQSHKMERHSSIIKPNSTELVSALSHKAETLFPFEWMIHSFAKQSDIETPNNVWRPTYP